jgi:hypothetical protein
VRRQNRIRDLFHRMSSHELRFGEPTAVCLFFPRHSGRRLRFYRNQKRIPSFGSHQSLWLRTKPTRQWGLLRKRLCAASTYPLRVSERRYLAKLPTPPLPVHVIAHNGQDTRSSPAGCQSPIEPPGPNHHVQMATGYVIRPNGRKIGPAPILSRLARRQYKPWRT